MAEIQNYQSDTATTTRNDKSERKNTYADALKNGAPAQYYTTQHHEVVTRSRRKARQVLLDGKEGGEEELAGLAEKVLVEKANIALELMDGNDAKEERAFKSVTKLRNGGILYEMDSEESANWIRKPTNRSEFLKKFGTETEIRDRNHHVLIDFVPCATDVSMIGMEGIERENGWSGGVIADAKWMRPVALRKPGQKVALLRLTCQSTKTANLLIEQGIVIQGRKLKARVLEVEPKRCLKCQHYGKNHLANACPDEKDTCGTCAGEHRTTNCGEKDPNNHKCVNCRDKGNRDDHPSWDRLCPTYLEYKKRIDDKKPESKYIYYPTEDPATWITTNEAAQPDPKEGEGEREERRQERQWRGGDRQWKADAGWGGKLGNGGTVGAAGPKKTRKTQTENRHGTQKTIVELLGAETRNKRTERQNLGNWDDDVELEEQLTRQGQAQPAGPPEWL